jgi:DNA-directed RNA polymerase specialized sigma24 family protein
MRGYKQAVWWDREIDREGHPIRGDVRQAAREIWIHACVVATSLLGDNTDAAEIMEVCVGRVSRYLTAKREAPIAQNTNALLMVAFRNAVLNRAARLRREASIQESELIEPSAAWGSVEAIETQIDLEKLARRLSPRSRTILVLRDAGYDWNEIAALFRVTVPAAKNRFHRELREAQDRLAGTTSSGGKRGNH